MIRLLNGLIKYKEFNVSKLTSKQQVIVQHLLDGDTNFEIGMKMDVAEATIKMHLTNLMKVHEVKTRQKLVCKLYKQEIDRMRLETVFATWRVS